MKMKNKTMKKKKMKKQKPDEECRPKPARGSCFSTPYMNTGYRSMLRTSFSLAVPAPVRFVVGGAAVLQDDASRITPRAHSSRKEQDKTLKVPSPSRANEILERREQRLRRAGNFVALVPPNQIRHPANAPIYRLRSGPPAHSSRSFCNLRSTPHRPSDSTPVTMSNNLICFGDVVKIASKSGFVDASDPSTATATDSSDTFLGFLEQKKELLLVVPPVKEDLQSNFKEAEFIVSAIRGDKPPAPGTPLKYKQPFVLKTSDGSGYSLNNKTPNMSEAVSLRECSVKGEMYLAVHKEGFSDDAHVHDGEMNVELMIVDSNRIRKTYNNKPLTHVAKAKSDTPGGVVSCSAKGRVLMFKLVKIADKTETRTFIKDPVFRRASQMLLDPVKADETSEASVLESPSRAGSIVGTTTGALVSEDALSSAPSSPKKHATPEMDAPMTSIPEGAAASETSADAAAAATQPVVETAVATTAATSAGGVSPSELATQLQSIVLAEKKVEEKTKTTAEVPETAGPIVAETVEPLTELATIELSAASAPDMDAMDGSAPVHDKFNLAAAPSSPSSTQPKSKTATPKAAAPASQTSEVETFEGPSGLPTGSDEQVDTACVGKCAIM